MRIHPSYHLAGASPLPLGVGYLLTAIPVLPSYWGFSDLGHGVSLHSRSIAMQLETHTHIYICSYTTNYKYLAQNVLCIFVTSEFVRQGLFFV